MQETARLSSQIAVYVLLALQILAIPAAVGLQGWAVVEVLPALSGATSSSQRRDAPSGGQAALSNERDSPNSSTCPPRRGEIVGLSARSSPPGLRSFEF